MTGIEHLENKALERLNTTHTVQAFFPVVVELIAEVVDKLILQAFRKDDYAVKYAVEPLLMRNGPLAQLSIRLKLIYALGIINRNEYEDCELHIALVDELNNGNLPSRFNDDEILGPISLLHDMVLPPQRQSLTNLQSDAILVTMQQQRYQQSIRSALVLAVSQLVVNMSKSQFR